MEGQSELLQQQTTLNRYLLYFPHSQTLFLMFIHLLEQRD